MPKINAAEHQRLVQLGRKVHDARKVVQTLVTDYQSFRADYMTAPGGHLAKDEPSFIELLDKSAFELTEAVDFLHAAELGIDTATNITK